MTLWLNILWLTVKLALFVLNKVKESQLIAQGEANALNELLGASNAVLEQVNAARTDPLPGVVVSDEYDRDNDTKSIADIAKDALSKLVPDQVQQQLGQSTDDKTDSTQQPSVDKS